jgi:putative transposase
MIKENGRTLQSWELSDAFWKHLEPLLPLRTREPSKEYQRKTGGGRKPTDFRKVFSGILYVLRTGCMWKSVPKTYGASSSIHRYFQYWTEQGVWMDIWKKGLSEYNEFEGIAWEWQSADGSMVKSPM